MSYSTPRDHGLVRAVLGDRPASALGRCDYHERLFPTSPIHAGDELDDEDANCREASEFRAADITTMVEATPTGLGRDPPGRPVERG
jgi:predicted metal-dependent phosphotriesterase family hydrolase